MLEDMKNIDEKFSIDNFSKQNHQMCQIHSLIKSDFQCPICKRYYCKDCFRIVEKKKNQHKGLCKKCFNAFKMKISIFFLLILIYILYIIGQNYNI